MRRASLLILLALVTWTVVVQAQETATQQQPVITRHWSKNPYPTTFPENARVYIIVKGDTLWDISERFYRNPLLWPHVHAANPYISDPHWIYPEDPVVLPDLAVAEPGTVTDSTPAGETAAGAAAATGAEQTPSGDRQRTGSEGAEPDATDGPPANFEEGILFETEPRPSREYRALASDLDLYCAAMIHSKMLPTDLYIAGSEERHQQEIQQYDIVYLNQGRDFLKPGDLFLASNYYGPIRSSDEENKLLGYAYQEAGVVRVLIATDNHAVAEVMFACDGLHIGTILTPFKQLPNPMYQVRETMNVYEQYYEYDRNRLGRIVYTNYRTNEAAPGDVVGIDLGSDRGLNLGDRILVVRDTTLVRLYEDASPAKVFSELEESGGLKPKDKVVGRAYAEGVVMRLNESFAMIKLTYAVDFAQMGDKVIAAAWTDGPENK